MALREYDVEVGPYGRTTTLQLSDEDAKARGLTPSTKAGKAPANKAAKAPANKGGSPAEAPADDAPADEGSAEA